MKRALFCTWAFLAFCASGEANRYVAANETLDTGIDVSVDQFSVEAGTFVKDGDGTLEIGGISQFDAGGYNLSSAGLNIEIDGGSLATKNPIAPVADATLADRTIERALVHFDASVAESVETDENGVITVWRDLSENHNDAYIQAGTPTNRIARLNGLNTIDFCGYEFDQYGNNLGAHHKSWAKFNRVAVRSGFIIFTDLYSWEPSFVIGDTDYYNFHRNGSAFVAYFDGNTYATGTGEWRANGVRINALAYQLAPLEYHLMSFRLDADAYTSTFCYDRNIRIADAEVAEAIYFDEKLSDDEMRAIEEKLLEKWFDSAHPAETPSPLSINTLKFGQDAEKSFSVAGDAPVKVGRLDTDGAFAKDGDGAMSVTSMTNVTGLAVNGGSLAVAGSLDAIFKKAFIHADPSDSASVTTNSDGQILRMESVNGNGRYLFPTAFSWDSKPTLQLNEGRPVVDCGEYAYGSAPAGSTASALTFSEQCVNLREAFVVCYRRPGSGSFLLGCSSSYNFHADTANILVSYAREGAQGLAVSGADWRIDNVSVDPFSVNFAGDLAVYSVNGAGYDYYGTDYGGIVDRLGSDRDICAIGGIQYGEVLVFNQYLSESERDMVRNYLMKKWLGRDIPADYDVLGSLSVSAGGSFSFAGNLDLSGAAVSFGFPVAEGGAVEISGFAKFDALTEVSLVREAGVKPAAGTYTLMKTGGLVGIGDASGINVVDPLPGYAVNLFVDGGDLYATIRQNGFTVIIK